MYERHFGLTGRPFGITPAADLFFQSSGHRRALVTLGAALFEGERLLVMTGEIGAGKTTLIQTLLRQLEPEPIRSVVLVSTHLDAIGVSTSVLHAFAVKPDDDSLAGQQAQLLAFVARLATRGQRALVVVDEAQNLLPDAIDHLLHLATLPLPGSSALQILLAGQPELRAMLPGVPPGSNEPLVFVSCHLGPLRAIETRAYIEHRLGRVGWSGTPSFSVEAYAAIHRATGGVPRRINRLCDRLLVAAYLDALDTISGEQVAEVDAQLREELGDPAAAPPPGPAEVSLPSSQAARVTFVPPHADGETASFEDTVPFGESKASAGAQVKDEAPAGIAEAPVTPSSLARGTHREPVMPAGGTPPERIDRASSVGHEAVVPVTLTQPERTRGDSRHEPIAPDRGSPEEGRAAATTRQRPRARSRRLEAAIAVVTAGAAIGLWLYLDHMPASPWTARDSVQVPAPRAAGSVARDDRGAVPRPPPAGAARIPPSAAAPDNAANVRSATSGGPSASAAASAATLSPSPAASATTTAPDGPSPSAVSCSPAVAALGLCPEPSQSAPR